MGGFEPSTAKLAFDFSREKARNFGAKVSAAKESFGKQVKTGRANLAKKAKRIKEKPFGKKPPLEKVRLSSSIGGKPTGRVTSPSRAGPRKKSKVEQLIGV